MIIRNSVEIDGEPERVYAIAKSIYSFPEIIPDVKSIMIIESNADDSEIICEWKVIIKQLKTLVRWVARDIWDSEAMTCRFSILKSDYYTYSGLWTFTDLGDRTLFNSEIEIECDLPIFGTRAIPFVANVMAFNINSMLRAIKSKVEN